MKNPDAKQYIEDMKEAVAKILDKTSGLSLQQIYDDEILRLAIERLLEILGEAANKVPKELQAKFPNVPWRKVIALRNIIAHNYNDIDFEIIYNTIQKDIPELQKQLNIL